MRFTSPPQDPADHAEDFARRYAVDLDLAAGQVMLDLSIDPCRIGASDPADGFLHRSFHPAERTCGSIAPDGRITLDSGVMNPEVMDVPYGKDAGDFWRRNLRLRDRMQAITAHEYEEHCGGSHDAALLYGPITKLPISDAAREMLRKMDQGWRRSQVADGMG